MTRAEKTLRRRMRAWLRWQQRYVLPTEVVQRAWAWVVAWDAAYHEAVLSDFLDRYA